MCEIVKVDGALLMGPPPEYEREDWAALQLTRLQEGYCPRCKLQLERHYHVGLARLHDWSVARLFCVEPSFGNCPECHHDWSLREGQVMMLRPDCCRLLSRSLDSEAVPSG